jgi:hypothetical protein
MSCETLREAIVDFGRGQDVGLGTAAAIETIGAGVWWSRSAVETQRPAEPVPVVAVQANSGAGRTESARPEQTQGPAAPVARPAAPARPQSPRFISAEGFVPLPAAVGLPDFESGEIVRMELPVTSLPAYGLEIAPDARQSPVEADVLVGQDGQARAIRLVPSSETDRKGN